METQFTPGPWQTADDGDGYRIEGYGNPMGTVAVLTTRRSVTGKADANLIAAAPDLYAALAQMENIFRDRFLTPEELTALKRSDAALAKARGEK